MRASNRRALALLTAIAALSVALVAAGCGGDNNNNSSSASNGGGGIYGGGGGSTTSTAASTGGGTAVISVADNPKLGEILVDSQGKTLYYFLKDKQGGTTSTCSGACAGVWPPVTGTPKGEKGAQTSKLGTIKRSDGSTEVTYNGWPLYTYTGDSKPGDTNGNDFEQFGAEWYAITPAGTKPKA